MGGCGVVGVLQTVNRLVGVSKDGSHDPQHAGSNKVQSPSGRALTKEEVEARARKRIEEMAAQGVFRLAVVAMTSHPNDEEYCEEAMILLDNAVSLEGVTVQSIGLDQSTLAALQTGVRKYACYRIRCLPLPSASRRLRLRSLVRAVLVPTALT